MWEMAWRRPSTDSVFISGLAMVGTLRTRTAHSSSAYSAPRPDCTWDGGLNECASARVY